MDTKHTPGPWKHEVLDEPRDPNGSATVRLAISSEAGDCVCRIWSRSRPYRTAPGRHHNRRQFPLDDEAEANARLIAAAPSMLKELKSLEWVGRSNEVQSWSECPSCYGTHPQHAKDCSLASILAAVEETK